MPQRNWSMDDKSIAPIIIKETSRHESKDLAAIVQAATKSNSVLSAVWYKRVEPRFAMTPEELGAGSLALGIGVGVLAVYMGAETAVVVAAGLGVSVATAVTLLLLAYRHADVTEYEISYEAVGKEDEAIRHTYRIEMQQGNTLSFVDMPEWFTRDRLIELHRIALAGAAFNIRSLTKNGICTQQQFPMLREKMVKANFLVKDGKSWVLANAFFRFADKERAKLQG